MKLRVSICMVALVLIALSCVPLFARQTVETPGMCCGSASDCAGGEKCCDSSELGQEDCSEDRPGYCQTQCQRGGGGAEDAAGQ